MSTIDIELQCVGNEANLPAYCSVRWIEGFENDETRRAVVMLHLVQPKSHKRESRVNYVTYELLENMTYHYKRYVSTKPQTYEEKWFKLIDGNFTITGKGDGNQPIQQWTVPIEQAYLKKGYAFWVSWSEYGLKDRALVWMNSNTEVSLSTNLIDSLVRVKYPSPALNPRLITKTALRAKIKQAFFSISED